MEDINYLQDESFEFFKKRFKHHRSKFDSSTMFIHLVEEVGEIGRQVFNKETGMRELSRENLEEELGQALIDLMVLMKLEGFEAEELVRKKLDSMKKKYVD